MQKLIRNPFTHIQHVKDCMFQQILDSPQFLWKMLCFGCHFPFLVMHIDIVSLEWN